MYGLIPSKVGRVFSELLIRFGMGGFRCDVRTMSTSGTVVTILAWLLRIGEEPPASDILIITGVKKNVVSIFNYGECIQSFTCAIHHLGS